MTLFPSACIWSYRLPMKEVLHKLKITAFHYVDVEPTTLDEPGAHQTLKDLGLKVSCVALDHNMPPGCSWDGKDEDALRKTVNHLKQALEKSQSLEARAAYVGPCVKRKQLDRFRRAVVELAQDAAQRGIKFCVEHVPGKALSTARETFAFLQELGQANLYLLLDVGHTVISKEQPWEIAEAAGDRLGYVQLNDNDGKEDRHWPLLDGRLTRDDLIKMLKALKQIGYDGTLGLELSPKLPILISSFSKNRNLVLRLQENLDAIAK